MSDISGRDNTDFAIKTVFGMRTPAVVLGEIGEITEEFAMNRDNDLESDDMDKDVKLFNDYIEEYSSSSNAKVAKKELFHDMTLMFSAATDTV